MSRRLTGPAALAVGLALTWIVSPVLAGKPKWDPIDPAVLAKPRPQVDPDAPAEVLGWEVWIDDRVEAREFVADWRQEIRIQIYTDQGRQEHSEVQIPYAGRTQVLDIAARTVLPDGRVLELDPKDVYDREIVRARGARTRVKSFTLPGVVPGAVIEYRWRERRWGSLTLYDHLPFQLDIPIRKVTYHVSPLSVPGLGISMRYRGFNFAMSPFVRGEGDFVTSAIRQPAWHDEPFSPPEDETKDWVLLYYSDDNSTSDDEYWAKVAEELHMRMKWALKGTGTVRDLAAEAAGGKGDDPGRLERLYRWCRSEIRNASSEEADLSPAERARAEKFRSANDILKSRLGDDFDVDVAFAAMARALGYDARLVFGGDRSELFFAPARRDQYFLRKALVAVKQGDGWGFYDPGVPRLEFGTVPWQEERQKVLQMEPDGPRFLDLPGLGAERSRSSSVADLELAENGTLSGVLHLTFTGHEAFDERERLAAASPDERERRVAERVQSRTGTATVSDVSIEALDDPERPLVLHVRIEIPGYAQRTGSRLLLQPAVTRHAIKPLFPGTTRRLPICFDYPWSAGDTTYIRLPSGWRLESPEAPAPAKLAGAGESVVSMATARDGGELVYRRAFHFDHVMYDAKAYPAIKAFFDAVEAQDRHTLALRRADEAP